MNLNIDSTEFEKLAHHIKAADSILITTHQWPDGDAVGSVMALTRALRQIGKQATPHTPDPPPAFAHILPDTSALIHGGDVDTSQFDLLIATDHSTMERTGLIEALRKHPIPTIGIDHHESNDRGADVNIVVPDAAATCEIITDLLPALDLPIDSGTATCLILGIVTDTGSFQHANTTPHTMETASILLRKGAHFRAVIQATFGKTNIAALRLVGRALERVQTSSVTGAAMSVITFQDMQECEAKQEDLGGVANIIGSVPGASYSILLTEPEEGLVKGSLRSEPRHNVDVAKIAAQFGGGGHKLAAGFELPGTITITKTGWRIV